MAEHLTMAERYRAHREAFELGLELGITPAAAAEEIARRAAVEKHRIAMERLQAKREGQPLPPRNPITSEQAFANTERLLGEH